LTLTAKNANVCIETPTQNKHMTNHLQNRTEHSRSLEDAERLRALHFLTEIGMFIPASATEMFHGRVAKIDEPDRWKIDPTFKNGSNDTGNHNVYNRPALYTAHREIAEDYTDLRYFQSPWPDFRRSLYKKVTDYTDTEQRAWLRRINNYLHTSGNNQYSHDDLSHPDIISQEARRLEHTMDPEEKKIEIDRIRNNHEIQLHQIVLSDPDALIFNVGFSFNGLDAADSLKVPAALDALLIPLSEGSPTDFDERHTVESLLDYVERLDRTAGTPFISEDSFINSVRGAGVNEDEALKIIGAVNARLVASTDPGELINLLLDNDSDEVIMDAKPIGDDNTIIKVPINLEYVKRYLQQSHIVGHSDIMNSVNIGKKFIGVMLFDLNKAHTADSLEQQRADSDQTFEAINSIVSSLEGDITAYGLQSSLDNPYVKPEAILEEAQMIPGYAAIFQAHTGNWEGFNLAEHTETTLRNLDENFADTLPVSILRILRLALLVHDIGKPAASKNHDMHLQKKYNYDHASVFLTTIGVKKALKEFILSMIGDGEEIAARLQTRRDQSAQQELEEYAKHVIEAVTAEPSSYEAVIGYAELCKIVQICNGGAYTDMAVTRGKTGYYRNAPSFNGAFTIPTDLGRRALSIRQ
jgi:hypothetical protein